jgi:hypothetical protein
MAVGASYIFLGYNFLKSELEKLSGILFGLGAAFVLGSALILGGWSPNQNFFWELIFPGLAFGALFLSVPLKSKGFLAVGTLSLMVYIGKITAEYFSEGVGWPMALIFCGFMMIGIGYLAFWINQNYLKNKSNSAQSST